MNRYLPEARLEIFTQFNETSEFRDLKVLTESYPKYFKLSEYDIDKNGTKRPCLEVLTKLLPMTLSFKEALLVLKKLERGYGKRSEAISKSTEIVDWKAMMHASRIIYQARELFTDGIISLPRSSEEVVKLLAIRRGEIGIEEVKVELSKVILEVEALVEKSKLPSSNDPEFLENFERVLFRWAKMWYNNALL